MNTLILVDDNVSEIDLCAFYLLGERAKLRSDNEFNTPLRPALFAQFHDLSKLRYDFPLLLLNDLNGSQWVTSLADLIDEKLQKIAPKDVQGEEIRRQVLHLEDKIRQLVKQGQTSSLSLLWEEAKLSLLTESDKSVQQRLNKNIEKVQANLTFEGEVVDCNSILAKQFFNHAWQYSQHHKSQQLRTKMDCLIAKLSDILRFDNMQSSLFRDAKHLQHSVGTGDQQEFDFQAMAEILKTAPVAKAIPKIRLKRLKGSLQVLKTQRFIACKDLNDSFNFAFDDCHLAIKAFRERLPAMAELVKAISIAELEIENRYEPLQHDHFYEQFDQEQLSTEDIAQFPCYLLVLENAQTPEIQHTILDILRSGLPFKVVAQQDDIIGDMSNVVGQQSFAVQGQQLARMASGLSDVFVLQASVSSLYKLRNPVLNGLNSDLPALFSVYCPNKPISSCYLEATAATESRAFPCFVFDPVPKNAINTRFKLFANPSMDQNWPIHMLDVEDLQLTRHSQQLAFTIVDFIACDKRFSTYFACIEASAWADNMLPVDQFINLNATARKNKVPYVQLIDQQNNIYRVLCNIKLIDAAERCLKLWQNLIQQSEFIDTQTANALLFEKEAWQVEKQHLLEQIAKDSIASEDMLSNASDEFTGLETFIIPTTEIPVELPVKSPIEFPIHHGSADPWIETLLCTSCNECIEFNERMFAYDSDMRAYIADPDAGSYRQLVEAAENCQVAIIHPGKPRNLNEEGLDGLIARAQPFIN